MALSTFFAFRWVFLFLLQFICESFVLHPAQQTLPKARDAEYFCRDSFICRGFNKRKFFGKDSNTDPDQRASTDTESSALDQAMMLQKQARELREEARAIEQSINETKAEKLRLETEAVDRWIDELLFVNITSCDSNTQLLHTQEKVAQLLQDYRFSAEHVNRIFDRICATDARPQSCEQCSPLIELLLDAACQVDCMEREDNPNKRWNHRVERDLRKKLFAMGWGIDLDKAMEEREEQRRARGWDRLTGGSSSSGSLRNRR